MTDKLITDLQELTSVTEDTFVPVRNATAGTRKYNLKALGDAVDEAAGQAQDAADAAETAATAADSAAARATAAAEAAEGVVLDAVPTMTANIKGGAKLGSGLRVDGGALSLGDVVTDSCDGPIYSVDAQGWAEQRSTTGKNLLNPVNAKLYRGGNGTLVADNMATSYAVHVAQNTDYVVSYAGGNRANVIGVGNTAPAANVSGDYIVNNSARVSPFTFNSGSNDYVLVQLGYNSETPVSEPQLEAGSTATSYEPYSGGAPSPSPDYPQEIKVARGRNLATFESGAYATATGLPVASTNYVRSNKIKVQPGDVYTLSADGYIYSTISLLKWAADGSYISAQERYTPFVPWTITIPSDTYEIALNVWGGSNVNPDLQLVKSTTQLELGTTPTPYVPYGHVGLEVRDATTQALVSCTPIPLPSKGFAAALPDGTCDALAIDSAGKWEWTSASGMVTFDGDENWAGSGKRVELPFSCKKQASGTETFKALCDRFAAESPDGTYVGRIGFSSNTSGNAIFFSDGTKAMVLADWKTWLASNPVTVLYPLATPTTETAYIDLPEAPEGSTITIPELESVDVKCFVPGAAELAQHAANWGHRSAEMESRLATLEAAVAELATA